MMNMKKIKNKIKEYLTVLMQPAVGILPGQLAFFLVLSIFPLLTLIGIIASYFSISVDSLIDLMYKAFPTSVADLFTQFVEGKGFDTNVGLFMIIGYILASNGTHSITLASNILYGFPNDDYLKRRIKALIMIIILIILFMFMLVFLAFGNHILSLLLQLVEDQNFANIIYKMFVFLKWPFSVFIIYFNIKILYTIAPDWKILSATTTRGALFTTFGWTIATAIFSYYITNFARYDIFYGSLSNIVVLMMWVYILSYILVVGIAINANEYKDEK